MCFCLRGLDAKDKMRDMATHSRLRAHGLIRDNRYHIDLVKKMVIIAIHGWICWRDLKIWWEENTEEEQWTHGNRGRAEKWQIRGPWQLCAGNGKVCEIFWVFDVITHKKCRFLDRSHIFVYPFPANNLFSCSTHSFGFGDDLEKDDIDNCARCNTWFIWFYQRNCGLYHSKKIKKVKRKPPCNIWRGRSIWSVTGESLSQAWKYWVTSNLILIRTFDLTLPQSEL